MPPPGTHYFLWPGANPDNLDWAEMDRLWAAEAARWGGENEIAAHWLRYRELDHEFLLCNILTSQDELLKHIGNQRGSVIWWSNAFCTIFSACHYTLEEKQELYEIWIGKLAAKAPGILLYGSDHSNSPVNCIRCRRILEKLPGRAEIRWLNGICTGTPCASDRGARLRIVLFQIFPRRQAGRCCFGRRKPSGVGCEAAAIFSEEQKTEIKTIVRLRDSMAPWHPPLDVSVGFTVDESLTLT